MRSSKQRVLREIAVLLVPACPGREGRHVPASNRPASPDLNATRQSVDRVIVELKMVRERPRFQVNVFSDNVLLSFIVFTDLSCRVQ